MAIQVKREVSAEFRCGLAIGMRLIQALDQRFGNGIKLAEELQNALLIERRQLSILPPFQRGAVELINLEGPTLGHGEERHSGPPSATIG
jgi:hypothetical protein